MAEPYNVDGVYQMSPDAMWRQAMAEFEARKADPRTDGFGKTLQEDTDEALREELFAPLQMYQGKLVESASRARERPYSVFSTGGGELTRVDNSKGIAEVIKAGRPNNSPAPQQVAAQKLVQDKRRELDSIPSTAPRRAAVAQELANAEAALGMVTQPEATPFEELAFEPRAFKNEGFIGTPGGRNRFVAPQAPSVSATKAPVIQTENPFSGGWSPQMTRDLLNEGKPATNRVFKVLRKL